MFSNLTQKHADIFLTYFNFEIKRTNTLGLKLIQTLTKQIDGKLKITNDKGVVFSISFKEIT